MYALKEAHPSLDRKVIEMILEHPLKLGHHSFIDTLAKEVSSISRIMVAQCIIDFVQETDQLKDITLELYEAFQSDGKLYSCL
jgi:hypothetical protein